MTPQLRDYQKEAVENAMRELTLGNDTLIVSATGTGKTSSISEIVRLIVESGGRVLVLAHRRELLDQLNERMKLFGLAPAFELGKKRAGRAKVVVSSVQTMANRLDEFSSKDFQLVVVDEAHHAPARGYRLILDYFQAGGARVLGATATPDRLDQVPLGTIFESVASRYDIVEAIADGWLVPAKGLRVEVEGFDLSSVRQKVMGVHTPDEGWGDLGAMNPGEVRDLHPGDLGKAAIKPEAVEGVVGPLMELAEDRRTFVFAVNTAHADALVVALNAKRADCARVVHSKIHKGERKRNLDDHKAGKYQYLVNVNVLTEGYDDPEIGCVAMVRPTQSRTLYAQAAGRGLRPCKEIGKKYCIAEGQLVLTDHGLVPIERVTKAMRVWDGIEFVQHDGIVFRGEKEVIEYAGLIATPDHEVWTDAGWVQFGECAREQIGIRVTEAEGQAVREVVHRVRHGAPTQGSAASGGEVLDVWQDGLAGLHQPHAEDGGLSLVCATGTSAQVALAALRSGAGTLHESEQLGLQSLRGARGGVPVLGTARHGALGRSTSRAQEASGDRSHGPEGALRSWEPALPDAQAERVESSAWSAHDQAASDAADEPGSSVRGRHDSSAAVSGAFAVADRGEVPQHKVAQTTRRVWDILNAGPRHRFTVSGLLVSNCLVLDFVGVSCQHDLVGPEDALAGALVGEVEDFNKPEKWPTFVEDEPPVVEPSLDDLAEHVGLSPTRPNPAKSGQTPKMHARPAYRPTGLVARFTATVVELIKDVGRAIIKHMDPKKSFAHRFIERAKKKWKDLGKD